jgi:hypothetical protein
MHAPPAKEGDREAAGEGRENRGRTSLHPKRFRRQFSMAKPTWSVFCWMPAPIPNRANVDGTTRLDDARMKGQKEIAGLLIARGAKVNTRNRRGHAAAQRGAGWECEVVKLLLAMGPKSTRATGSLARPRSIIAASWAARSGGTPARIRCGSNHRQQPRPDAAQAAEESGQKEVVGVLRARK